MCIAQASPRAPFTQSREQDDVAVSHILFATSHKPQAHQTRVAYVRLNDKYCALFGGKRARGGSYLILLGAPRAAAKGRAAGAVPACAVGRRGDELLRLFLFSLAVRDNTRNEGDCEATSDEKRVRCPVTHPPARTQLANTCAQAGSLLSTGSPSETNSLVSFSARSRRRPN